MKWFTHNTNARTAKRLKKFIRIHGAAGYGLWWALVEAVGEDYESCGGWTHPEFDLEDFALDLGFKSVAEIKPMLETLERLKDVDGRGLILIRNNKIGIPSLQSHLSEHLAKKQKRSNADWDTFSGESNTNTGVEQLNTGVLQNSPENHIQSQVLKERTGEERTGEEKSNMCKSATDSARVEVLELIPDVEKIDPAKVLDQRFIIFWTAYPNKRNKGGVKKIWKRLKPSQKLLDKMLDTITEAKKSEQWQKDKGQFIPLPATWLNNEGWDDEFGNIKADSFKPIIWQGSKRKASK
jgi:hypothetical protein